MTVAELIEKLKTFDQSLPVWLGGSDGQINSGSIDEREILEREVITEYNYGGPSYVEHTKARVLMIEIE